MCMLSIIKMIKDTLTLVGPFDQTYIPITVDINPSSGLMTLKITGTSTIVIGTSMEQLCTRLMFLYSKSEHIDMIKYTLEATFEHN